ncbi:IS21-like element ISMbo1 family transposase [Georgenia daeguensis]|uniref:IS21-like element ISMbo1 family transposase n=1 Tax=Georgenia daeguensis TaxID=908355 RepID=A0ABP6USH3_9MICO
MEDWAEIRRLHKSEGMAIKAIARHMGVARNTVRAALASESPPRYERRKKAGSLVDGYEPQIRALLAKYPTMPATVIGERIGWEHSASVLRARVAQLRPLYAPADPADRTEYRAGEIVQCDLWFPPRVVPVGPGVLAAPPVLTMVAAWSGFIAALLLPTRQTGDLLAGMWQLLSGSFGAVPKTLVWDNEAGIGQHQRLTVGARAFAGTLGTRIYQTRPRDPEAKGVVERANGYLQTSFLPGREFASPADFNDQLGAWLPRANQRVLRRTGVKPAIRVGIDVAAMADLPPVPPAVGLSERVRLGRDYYVRVAGNDYSVDPSVIGRFVDVRCDLTTVTVTCAGQVVAAHERCWDTRRTITDPAHVATAKVLRTAYRTRAAAGSPPARAGGEDVGIRALSDYDDLFAIGAPPAPSPDPVERVLEVVAG